ncbi:MarR family transcriptional regulator [Bifidobacterium sp. 82T10]|uniref:MarR family transcriptional regulator n=1 Tax=Bifidobacterium miconis TaxID=2834435 RepID=A0ABS6WD75_9BIFI|nr:MarR family transcriptional regulator [Bifidobacterium miconis]MBW3092006.1 MarR family transcriptional regulator [Bifidobacterium miconis]
MDQHVLSVEMRMLTKAVDRYLGESMPESARAATGGNARIIIFLDRNRDKPIYQHTIEQKFCITRSTASRVLALMEKKGLIVREPVPHDARLKRIVLTPAADDIVADLKANGERTERLLVEGLTTLEQETLRMYIRHMRENIDEAQKDFERHHTVSHSREAVLPERGPDGDRDDNMDDMDDMKEESK